MGWKSTANITKKEALELLFKAIMSSDTPIRNIEYAVEAFYGDDPNLPYYGNNFMITDE